MSNSPIYKIFNSQKILGKVEKQGEIPSDETLLKTTLKIAWPSTLESFLIALVAVIDTLMVSSLGEGAIAAIGLTSQPKFIVLAVFFAISTSVSAIVARRRGEGDKNGANRVLLQAMMIGAVLCAIISVLAIIFANEILTFAGTNSDTHEQSVAYFRIIVGGICFTVFSLIINAAQRGAGNTKIAMRTNIISNLVNVTFNYLLINGNFGFPALGVSGAAIATVIGSMVAMVLSVRSVLNPTGFIYLGFLSDKFRFDKKTSDAMLRIGSGSFFEQIFLRIGFFLYAIIIAELGTIAFAAHQIGMNFTGLSFSFADGLSVAAIALVGRSLGEGRIDLAKIYAQFCQKLGLICSAVLSIIFIFFGRELFSLFSNDAVVLDYGIMLMRFLSVITLLQISQVIFTGALRAAGDNRYVALVSLVSVAIFRPIIGYVLCFTFNLGLTGAWLALMIDQGLRFALNGSRFAQGKWTKMKF